MSFSPLINELVDALRVLPGVGPKSAQRMALHLLERDTRGAKRLVNGLGDALEKVGRCKDCRTLTEEESCPICLDPKRDQETLCVVETPADVFAVEQTGGFKGRYFVLYGHLSPIDGIGPDDIGLPTLFKWVEVEAIKEVIVATNLTVEGEATANFIADALNTKGITTSRIAHGVPLGGELEYVDGGTLAHAFAGRKKID